MSDLSAIHCTKQRELQPKVGISACLVGKQVRYDGGDKYHQLIDEQLSPWLNLQVICPEMEAGLGVPRPPVQLVEKPSGDADEIQPETRAIGVENNQLDITQLLADTAKELSDTQCQELCAYIVKARSPSCGSGSTPSYHQNGDPAGDVDGLFVRALKTAYPNLIIVEESSLGDIEKCREFLEACYTRNEQ